MDGVILETEWILRLLKLMPVLSVDQQRLDVLVLGLRLFELTIASTSKLYWCF
jgi:hypothetical protein